jgi:hydroxymethylpyrimidine pyrophosphatase-like HAD family hydrolase
MLFVSDIDECLARPFHPYDLTALCEMARLTRTAAAEGRPAVSLMSGRAFPYVEAMSQLLGCTAPVVFESGGGMFEREAGRVTWNPLFTPEVEAQIRAVAEWMARDLLPTTTLQYDYGKRTQAGVIGPDVAETQRVADRVRAYQEQHYPDLVTFNTPVSVDVLSRQITKEQAVGWLVEVTGVALGDMAFIGDSNGDLGAIRAVGMGCAPANAVDEVRAAADFVSAEPFARGVLEAYTAFADRT